MDKIPKDFTSIKDTYYAALTVNNLETNVELILIKRTIPFLCCFGVQHKLVDKVLKYLTDNPSSKVFNLNVTLKFGNLEQTVIGKLSSNFKIFCC